MTMCKRCCYDDALLPGIVFNEAGVCNYCEQQDQFNKTYPTGKTGKKILYNLAKQIREQGRGKDYDCIVGFSGGCDSSYLLYVVKEHMELNPLAVQFDNHFNTKTAEDNMRKITSGLGIDLKRHIVDKDEFVDLARSMMYASVPEIDALTDVGIISTWYEFAEKYDCKYILDGHSFRTEGISPHGLFYFDGGYIESIHKEFGYKAISTFPNLTLEKWTRWLEMGIKRPKILYYLDYNKPHVRSILNTMYGWEWYGGNHMENRYTDFEINYWIYKKFNLDLRIVPLSASVRQGELSQEDALLQLSYPVVYPPYELAEIKRELRFYPEEFESIMNRPNKSHKDYQTYKPRFKEMKDYFHDLMERDIVPKSFYEKYCE